jgi:F-type H+-transporting ATPase subunit b
MLFASSNFLIPNGTFVVDVVIFLVVLGVVSKWILPPLLGVANDRRAGIRAALQAADDAKAERREVLIERERVLNEARAEARSVIDQANQAAESERIAARGRGQEEYDRLMDTSRAGIEAERTSARAELVGNLESLVVAAAERVLGSQVDGARHRALIDEAVAAASGAAPTGAGT